MDYVGRILSGSSVSEAVMRIEGKISIEDLVFIKSGEGSGYLSVVRDIQYYDELLSKYKSQLPAVDVDVFKYKNATLKLLGEVRDNRYVPYVTSPPRPSSPCYRCNADFLNLVLGSNITSLPSIGYHKFSGFKIGIRLEYITQHVGIFGATGTGKSVTTRRLIKTLLDNGYRVLVFDHTGVDYAPYFPNVVCSSDVKIAPSSISKTILRRCDLNPQTYSDYIEIATYSFLEWFERSSKSDFERFRNEHGIVEIGENDAQIRIRKGAVKDGNSICPTVQVTVSGKGIKTIKRDFIIKSFSDFIYAVYIQKVIDVMQSFGAWGTTQVKFIIKFINSITPDQFMRLVSRKYDASQIVDNVLKNDILVVDLSYDPIENRYGIINDVVTEVWNRIESSGKPLSPPLVIVIDEAQNYAKRGTACYYILARTVREGRKWGLGLVVASQRFIYDIEPEIRQNLCTVLFSKMQTGTDLSELNKVIDLGGVTMKNMSVLERGDFFIVGLMNPLPHPILLHINPYPNINNDETAEMEEEEK